MKYILPKCSVQEHKSLSMVNSAVRNIVTNYNANQVIGGPGLEKAEKGEGEFRTFLSQNPVKPSGFRILRQRITGSKNKDFKEKYSPLLTWVERVFVL